MPQPSRPASSAADPGGLKAAAFAVLDARLDGSGPLALALSGGGDSIALLHMAAAWAKTHERPLIAFTVDHGLNPDSARWTADAGQAAQTLGLSWRPLAWTGEKPASGLPAAARAARHALLAEAARQAGAKVILTGHTQDDVLEGELIRTETPVLGRLSDWSPSPAWPQGRGLFLCRPLLEIRRAALRHWLTARRIPWLDDPANDDERFARARARKSILVSTPWGKYGRSPGGGLKGASADASTLQPPPPGACPRARAMRDPGGSPSPRGGGAFGVVRLPRALDARTLAAALLCASGTAVPPRGDALTALIVRIEYGDRFTATLAGARIDATGDALLIGRDPGRAGLPTVFTTPGQQLVWDGRFELIAEAGAVGPLAGRLAQLTRAERTEIAALPAWARPTLPCHILPDGSARLARGLPLGMARFRAALGFIERESDI